MTDRARERETWGELFKTKKRKKCVCGYERNVSRQWWGVGGGGVKPGEVYMNYTVQVLNTPMCVCVCV